MEEPVRMKFTRHVLLATSLITTPQKRLKTRKGEKAEQ